MMVSTSSSCFRFMGITLTLKGTFAFFLCHYICTSADRAIVGVVVLFMATLLVQRRWATNQLLLYRFFDAPIRHDLFVL